MAPVLVGGPCSARGIPLVESSATETDRMDVTQQPCCVNSSLEIFVTRKYVYPARLMDPWTLSPQLPPSSVDLINHRINHHGNHTQPIKSFKVDGDQLPPVHAGA